MKLCNYRWPRNGKGTCALRVSDVAHPETYRTEEGISALVFQGENPYRGIKCTEALAEVCSYRVHSKRPPPEPAKWYQCPNCGKKHRTERARVLCAGYAIWEQAFNQWSLGFSPQPFDPNGTKEQVYPEDLLKFPGFTNVVRDYLWPFIVGKIAERDNHTCQDCRTAQSWESRTFEVHHIIPRGMGGSDHPANLKLVCQNCHKKYNEKFNGEIISRKAQERKTKRIKEQMPKSLEEFA